MHQESHTQRLQKAAPERWCGGALTPTVVGVLSAIAVVVALLAGRVPTAYASADVVEIATNVDDFEFASFQAIYLLDRDDEGRSILSTRETLVALFPPYNQNSGITRVIPNRHHDRDTRLEIQSVTDETGAARDFTVVTDASVDVLTIGAEGNYVHGPQTYVIEYTQRDVTASLANSVGDEFFRDVNGTGWRQPFDQVIAELHIATELVGALTGDTACYRGTEGSSGRCVINRTVDAEAQPATYVAIPADGLGPHENIAIAVGFEPGTFTAG